MRGIGQTGVRAVGGLALAALLAAGGWLYARGWRPSPDGYPVQGVDVSAASGAIDWPTLAAGGADFAYVEATAGLAGRDPAFADNWAGAHAAGLRRGALHRFQPCAPAEPQANNFMVTVPRVADALPAAVVVEPADCPAPPDRAALVAALARFARRVEHHTGEPVIVQVSPAVERAYRLSGALERSLWATGGYLAPRYLARGWRLWRANGARRVDGAERPVGWDVVAP